MRNMSFALTTAQIRMLEKDVTRRLGWWFLESGAVLCAVEKCQGLKRGEKIARIHTIRVVGVRRERLDRMIEDEAYGREECRREGFPGMPPMAFVTMFCATHKDCEPSSYVNRIEFEHLVDTA